MWTQNKREDERLVDGESVSQIQSPLWEGFRRVHDFILKAVKGDQAAADAIFEDYLAGKLSEELLSISRYWVSADQAGSSKCEIEGEAAAQRQLREGAAGGVGVGDDGFTAIA
jgi:hypothetical protein